MGGQWSDGVGMWGALEGKGGSGGSSGSMGIWDEAVKNQSGLRGNTNNNLGLKNSRSSPSLTYAELGGRFRQKYKPYLSVHSSQLSLHSDQYMMRRKRTEDEEKLLKLLQGMKPQDGFTTWCEQMLHALNTSANNSSSSLDGTMPSFLQNFTKGRAEFTS